MLLNGTADLIALLGKSHLLEPAQVTACLQGRFSDPRPLIQELLRRNWLTPFQARRIAQGQVEQLALGPYLVLDQLGDGGMGQVFKARHRSLNRIVALKVIRPELVTDAETVARFYREMQVTSELSHPHLIRSYDAGPVGATHFLAMEYIEGLDLEQLVRQAGPLPVATACDYIRQAALGLQHIHEHGLVHRDIKPSNLLVTGKPGTQGPNLVKILDLGLARLQEVAHGKASTRLPDGKSITTLTLDGAGMLGTVDYMSPEQALDFHNVDIRGDIYSLGCTLCYLLTGKPPFGNGPLALKLMRHQQAERPDLARLRPEVGHALAAIAKRTLAKAPADRYATPAHVAQALAPFAEGNRRESLAGHRAFLPSRRACLASRRWLLTGSAFLLLVTAWGGAMLWLRGEPSGHSIARVAPSPAPPRIVRILGINCGGPTVGDFQADLHFSGGAGADYGRPVRPVDTSAVSNPAPDLVYWSVRYEKISYLVPGLVPGEVYTVRLHFAERYHSQPGRRICNVVINGVQVLSNFDIVAVTGGRDKAIVKEFPATADAAGTVSLQVIGVRDTPTLNGIEILGPEKYAPARLPSSTR
ncbi:MAG: protein kinase [Planctomycetia bacterium]|nr:protein kinase [Planctomycetia bacterium]